MTKTNRRVFLLSVAAGTGALACGSAASQSSAPVLSENDPQALALGYHTDSSKVDKAKYPQHAASQMCSGCNFFQGKPTDAMAPCQLYAGKQVMAKGWCTAWAKRA